MAEYAVQTELECKVLLKGMKEERDREAGERVGSGREAEICLFRRMSGKRERSGVDGLCLSKGPLHLGTARELLAILKGVTARFQGAPVY